MDYGIKCPNCGEEHHAFDITYNMDGIMRCRGCLDLDKETRPYYLQHIPNYVDGATAKAFIFTTTEELFKKLDRELKDGEIFVYDRNTLMVQSTVEKFWWVLGFIRNFDIEKLNIPHANYYIYNKDKTVNQDKLNEWLKDGDL